MLTSRTIQRNACSHLRQCYQTFISRTLYSKIQPVTNECSEVEIKVPWGIIAGKLWGPKDKQPILAMHGWQDNAGSFDNLIPLLQKDTPVLAIDLVGHGLSSWLPPGMMYNELIYMLLIERLRRHFGWEKIKLMGHSISGQIIFWYTTIFPKQVQFVITIDALKLLSSEPIGSNKAAMDIVNTFFKLEDMKTSIGYTEQEVIERWSKAVPGNLQPAACKILMIRGTRKTEDGKLLFNRDPRLKHYPFILYFTHEYFKTVARRITCPYLVIKARDFEYIDNEKNFHDTLEIMKENNKDVHYRKLPGKHHLHLTNAQPVAEEINWFLEKYNT